PAPHFPRGARALRTGGYDLALVLPGGSLSPPLGSLRLAATGWTVSHFCDHLRLTRGAGAGISAFGGDPCAPPTLCQVRAFPTGTAGGPDGEPDELRYRLRAFAGASMWARRRGHSPKAN